MKIKTVFRKDWNEYLFDYADRLHYDNIQNLILDIPTHVRFEDLPEGPRIYAVNNDQLRHCFDLIDRTVFVFTFLNSLYFFSPHLKRSKISNERQKHNFSSFNIKRMDLKKSFNSIRNFNSSSGSNLSTDSSINLIQKTCTTSNSSILNLSTESKVSNSA